ncbi:PLDc N-terminal domain-containing protein [Candidatus Pacearchaeota archaeon]|nr:PLDc N-terminal domain-containing protein [Candidatus Pacearchaeota archaeon]
MNSFFGWWFWPFAAAGIIIAIIIGVLLLAFWIWMIIDCAKRNFKNDMEKIIWILVIVLLGWIGALIYYIVIRAINPKGISKK